MCVQNIQGVDQIQRLGSLSSSYFWVQVSFAVWGDLSLEGNMSTSVCH
jgi:hypothetical protein